MATKLTTIAVDNAKPRRVDGERVRTEIPDRGCPGLFLIVQPSGAKSWALRYRVGGKSRKLTLGTVAGADGTLGLTLAAARAAAAQAQHRITLGNDPAAEKRATRAERPPAPADSVEAAVARFIELHTRRKTRPASQRATESIFRRLVLPAWRGRSIHDIRRRDVIALVEAVAANNGPIMANRSLAAVSKFFNWLVARDEIASSPASGVERPGVETQRDRILDDSEIRALWLASGDPEIGLAGPLVRMLLLTGARRGEVAGLRWSEINDATRVWTLPAARSKNKRKHEVPLAPQAWDIISALPRRGDYVFAVGAGHIDNLNRIKADLDGKLQFAAPWVLHDIRRSVASGLQRLGVPAEVIETALNHRSGIFRGMTGIYQRHDFAGEKLIALAKWADHLERLAGGNPATVVQFPGGAR